MEYEGRLPVNSLWAQQIPEETVRRTVRMITDYDDSCLRGYALNDDMDQALARTTASTGGRCQCVVTAKCSPWERAVISTAGIWKRKCSIFCRNIEKGSHSAGANVTSGADDAKGAGRALSSLHSLLRGGPFHWASTSRRRQRCRRLSSPGSFSDRLRRCTARRVR